MNDYVGLDSVQTVAEELGAIVQTEYTRTLTPPGKYINDARTITDKTEYVATLKDDVKAAGKFSANAVKVFMFEVTLSGLTNPATGETFKRPDRTWIDTKPYRKRVVGKRDEFYPGTTSDVVEYLRACGYNFSELRNINGIDAVRSILAESTGRQVGVGTGLEARGKKTGVLKANGKEFYRTPGNPAPGVYEGKKLYTKAFSDGKGGWLTEVTDDNGEVWQAGEMIDYFFKLGA